MFADLVRGAAGRLAQSRLRTTLTVGGIAIGIGALFSLLSTAEGVRQRVVKDWLSSNFMTLIYVSPRELQPRFAGTRKWRGGRNESPAPAAEPGPPLDDTAVSTITHLPGVRRVWPVVVRTVELVTEPTAPTASPTPAPPVAPRGDTSSSGDEVSAAGRERQVQGAVHERSSGRPPTRADSGTFDPGHDRPPPAADALPPGAAAGLNDRGTRAAAGDRGGPAPGATPSTVAAGEGRERLETILRGFDTDYFWNEDYLKIVAGKPFTDPSAPEALLSTRLLEDLEIKEPAAAVGRRLTIRWQAPARPDAPGAAQIPGFPVWAETRTETYRIVGVFEPRGMMGPASFFGLIVPTAIANRIDILGAEQIAAALRGARSRLGRPGIEVYLTPGAHLDSVESKIKAMGFETTSGAEIATRMRSSMLMLQAALGGLGMIALAVATLGIANTLLTAVYERMREIGVMKAVGARRRDIRRQFFAEAGLIGVVGGLLGIAGGFGADHLISAVVDFLVRRQGEKPPGPFAAHTLGIALGCLAFALALSLLAGTYPASRAARLDPVETLRYE